jgi:hypothetical protein
VFVPAFLGVDDVAFAVILGVDDDSTAGGTVPARHDGDLNFGVGIDGDVEDPSVTGEPRIGPAAVVANADGRDAVDEGHGFASRHGIARQDLKSDRQRVSRRRGEAPPPPRVKPGLENHP